MNANGIKPTGLTADTAPAVPAELRVPDSYRPDGAEVLREITHLVSEYGLPMPTTLSPSSYSTVLQFAADDRASVDAWAAHFGGTAESGPVPASVRTYEFRLLGWLGVGLLVWCADAGRQDDIEAAGELVAVAS